MKYILKRKEILAVEIINSSINESVVKIISSGQEIEIENCNIYNSKTYARMVKNEVNIKNSFKKSMTNKKGLLVCNCCGKRGKGLTVDHIKPLSAFGGRTKIRKDINAWKEAWDYSNLQILCKKCNQSKDTLPQNEFEKYDMKKIYRKGKILNNKKNILMAKSSREGNKAGFGISTSGYSKESELDTSILMQIARMDSRVLYKDLILK